MKVPFVDLQAQFHLLSGEMNRTMAEVIQKNAFIGGPYLKEFEKSFAAFCGVSHAVGVSNGTDALRLALLGCGVGPGDEVITTPNTFIATVEAVAMIGAVPRFVDVDPATGNLDPRCLEKALSPRTRAVVPVHLYGRPADMAAICQFAQAHQLKVVSDSAQAHGAVFQGKPLSQWGDAASFSFYPGKNLGAYGDAGAVVTNSPDVAARVALLRDHGRTQKYEHKILGFNCRMDGLQAAVLSVKLRYLTEWTQKRQAHARQYDTLLSSIPGIRLIKSYPGAESVVHLYTILCDDRETLRAHLTSRGIETGLHYPIPLHLQPALSEGFKPGDFPVAEAWARNVLSLPLFPELTQEQLGYVADAFSERVRAC
jgi:dTDP-4-amino-4,6-dideoxygalactose transaminase